MTHTPGPWTTDGPEVVSKKPPAIIAEICYIGEKVAEVAEREANARLISAAPDLLAALKLCAAVCSGETMHKNGLIAALEAARAAIAKATGGAA